MEVLAIIRWVALGLFIILFYLYEIKKKEQFKIPAQFAILVAILLHAIVRDWPTLLKVGIAVAAVIGMGLTGLKWLQVRRNSAV